MSPSHQDRVRQNNCYHDDFSLDDDMNPICDDCGKKLKVKEYIIELTGESAESSQALENLGKKEDENARN